MGRYRLYIDESGDHTYKNVEHLSRRYLGLAGVLLPTGSYPSVYDELEGLKRRNFRFEPDEPLVLVRRLVVAKEGRFGVLSNPANNERWRADVLAFLAKTPIRPYTVVIDKHERATKYGARAFEPYGYALSVLLRRVRGYLWNFGGQGDCDVIAESRGKKEDEQLRKAYSRLWTVGDDWFSSAEFQQAYPSPVIGIRKKEENIAGHQIADMLAAPQKELTIVEVGRPLFRPPSEFALAMNKALGPRASKRYGRNLL